MKKWYAIGLLIVALALSASQLVACGEEEATDVTAAATETTEAMTVTTEAMTETSTGGAVDTTTIGMYFEDMGNNVVKVTDVPAPGLQFPIHTTPTDEFASTVEAFDASGAKLGDLETADGLVDYSEYADTAAKIVVSWAGDSWEYMIP